MHLSQVREQLYTQSQNSTLNPSKWPALYIYQRLPLTFGMENCSLLYHILIQTWHPNHSVSENAWISSVDRKMVKFRHSTIPHKHNSCRRYVAVNNSCASRDMFALQQTHKAKADKRCHFWVTWSWKDTSMIIYIIYSKRSIASGTVIQTMDLWRIRTYKSTL